MSAVPEQLLVSTFWSLGRPKFPLSPGHYLIMPNDPAAAFGPESASDLLRCYGHLRRALSELMGATAAQLHISLNWHPAGDAVGEPLPESPTPALHVFLSWPGSPTASSALRLPAHQRRAARDAAMYNSDALDRQLLGWNGGVLIELPAMPNAPAAPTLAPVPTLTPVHHAGNGDGPWEPPGWEDRPFHIEPVHPAPGEPFRGGHWTAVPRFATEALDGMSPDALLELAETVPWLASHAHPPFQGVTAWAIDQWTSPAPAVIHIFARSHGAQDTLLSAFVAGGGLSPTVEK